MKSELLTVFVLSISILLVILSAIPPEPKFRCGDSVVAKSGVHRLHVGKVIDADLYSFCAFRTGWKYKIEGPLSSFDVYDFQL